MGPVAAAVVPAAASFIGGLLGNRSRAKEAQKNRNFQRNMRNTAWQAAVADMEAAGVNPAVAYSKGGAATPGGSMAQQQDIVTPAVSSALQAKTAQEQWKLVKAQADKARGEAESAKSQAGIDKTRWHWDQARYQYYFDHLGRAREPLMKLLRAEHGSTMANNARSVLDLDLLRLKEPEMKAISSLFERVGTEGKGLQLILPLIQTLLRR